MKLVILTALLIGAVYSFSYNNYYENVYSNLIEKESNWLHYRNNKVIVSKKNAIGIGQVTPIVLREYNEWFKTNHKLKELYNKSFNLKVSRWCFFTYLYLKYKGDIVNMVNAYNMGVGNTREGKYNFDYIKDIIPIEFSYWIRSKNIIRFYDRIWIVET